MQESLRPALLALASLALTTAAVAQPGDEHWSRQFPRPASTTRMGPGTGMSDGNTAPTVRRVKWHDGKLWMAGAWEAGVDPLDTSRQERNLYWHLWTWSPEAGYQAVSWFHTNQGGEGPDGQIYDFTWLPDGRLVVGGAFTRLDNAQGTRYHRVNALAVYDPNEPTANKWRPLGGFQYNGTVSEGGSIHSLAYDPQGNDLYVGGTFAGIREGNSSFVHRYDFDTGSFEPVAPGVGGQKPNVRRIVVDTSTKPSTVYVAGKFHYTAGDGQNPRVSSSEARYSTGLAAYQHGVGWRTFPSGEGRTPNHDEEVLQRAADFMHFDSVNVLDVHVEPRAGGRPDIWIAGAFSEGKGTEQTLRGIARWDWEGERWIDPTGKGGIGRECWSIGKADNGKLYFAGAFGGRNKTDGFFEGFKDGTPAHMAISYDPATDTWAQLGSGLSSVVFPECRMAVAGNDVYFVGGFQHIGPQNEGKKEWESHYIARWNETIDFTQSPAETAEANAPVSLPRATEPVSTGNQHWSRSFPAPGRRRRPDEPAHTGATGMDAGTGMPEIKGLVWVGDTLYFGGSYQAVPNERWYVWSYHAERGWEKVAWEKGSTRVGPTSAPERLREREGKLWVCGALADFKGVGIYDPATKEWSKLEGTFRGKPVTGHAVEQGGGTVNDFDWDPATGDLYLVGASGLTREDDQMAAKVIRVDPQGEYHPMGLALMPEDPGKPVKVLESLYLDASVQPTDIYIGGTFGYYGATTGSAAQRAYNVAKWDREAQDWRPVGKSGEAREIEREHYPDGLPGLPPLPQLYTGFLRTDFPRVQALTMDGEGNLYAGGTLAVLDDRLPVAERRETFGLAKLDKATGRWGPCTTVGGVSRDVLEMRWLDEARTQLLLCGAFEYDNAFRPLNGVAILDTKTGELRPLGGGLMLASRDQVVAPMIRHAVRGTELWFGGLFDHAGVNANDPLAAPVESAYVAMYDPTRSLDPNAGLSVAPVEPLVRKSKYGSSQAKVELSATLAGEGTITWYERRLSGDYVKKGEGPTYSATVRIGPRDDEVVLYVAVTGPDGSEGAKVPVRIAVVNPE